MPPSPITGSTMTPATWFAGTSWASSTSSMYSSVARPAPPPLRDTSGERYGFGYGA